MTKLAQKLDAASSAKPAATAFLQTPQRGPKDLVWAAVFALNVVALGYIMAYAFVEGDAANLAKWQPQQLNGTFVVLGHDVSKLPSYNQWMEELSQQLSAVEGNLADNYDLLAVAFAVGLLLGIVWLQLLKRLTTCIVYLTLALVVMAVGGVGLLLSHYSQGCLVNLSSAIGAGGSAAASCVQLAQPLSDNEAAALAYLSYAFFGLAGVLLLSVLFLRSKISVTVAVFEEACRGCLNNPSIVPVSLTVVTGIVSFHALWVGTWTYLLSVPSKGVIGVWYLEEGNVQTKFVLLYLVFSYFWIIAWMKALFHMCVAGIVGKWYFDRTAASQRGGSFCGSWAQLLRGLTVSLGSLAAGSLLVGCVGFLRYLLKKMNRGMQGTNSTATAAKCCVCCTKLLEKFVEGVTKYAYIFVALEGRSFCAAGKCALQLIKDNPVQLVVMNTIDGFVLWCGKAFLTCATTSFLVLALDVLDRSFSPLFVVLSAIALWHCFELQARIVSAASDTVFVCYIRDLELNAGAGAGGVQMTQGVHRKLQAEISGSQKDAAPNAP